MAEQTQPKTVPTIPPKATAPRPSEVGHRPEPSPEFNYDHWISRRDAEAEKYLLDKGWIKDLFGKWIDPNAMGKKPEEKITGKLPTRGGGEENITQLVLPPMEWPWKLQDAVALQQDRDRKAEKVTTAVG